MDITGKTVASVSATNREIVLVFDDNSFVVFFALPHQIVRTVPPHDGPNVDSLIYRPRDLAFAIYVENAPDGPK